MEYVNWITSHGTEIMAAIGGLVTFASVIVKMTPTKKDDEVLSWFMKFMNAVAMTPKK